MRLVRDIQTALGTERSHPLSLAARPDPAEDRPPTSISPADGAKAFTRILTSDRLRGVFVLPDGPKAITLPAETVLRPTSRRNATQDKVESALTEWWQELLGIEQLGLDDDFFELGGQSLIVVRLFSKIKKTYGINIGYVNLV